MDQAQAPNPNGPKVLRVSQSVLFSAFLAAGLLSIIIGKIFSAVFIFFSVICPLLCMAGYAFINLRLRKGEVAPSQVADNTYFLGFLFFLGSLAVTLVLVDKNHIEMVTFINGFGVALVTTIFGLACRILILQHTYGLPQSRERAEVTLMDAVSKFRKEVTISTQMLIAARVAAIDSITATVRSGNETFSTIVEQTKSTMESAANHVRDEMQNINIPSDLLINQLKPALDECTAAVRALNTVVKKQTNASATAVDSFGSVVASSLSVGEKSQELINTLQTAIADLQTKIGVFDTANVAVKSFSEQLTEVAAALEQIKNSAADINDLKLTEKVDALSAAVEATATATMEHVQGITGTKTHFEELNSAITGLKGRLAEVTTEVQETHRNMENVQNDLSSNMSRQAETLNGVSQMVDAIKVFVESQNNQNLNANVAEENAAPPEIVVSPKLVHDLVADKVQTDPTFSNETKN